MAALEVRFCAEFDGGFGWIVEEFMERCSHALVSEGRVWLVDPLAAHGIDERIHELGEPAGVLQLLDRHGRDCSVLAQRLAVPHHVVPEAPLGPFEFRPIRMSRRWREVALWWPGRKVLACADALGTARYYRAGAERLAVHPLLRLTPPRRRLAGLDPAVILCGHGAGIFDDAEQELGEALRTARRRIPGQVAGAASAWRRSRST